MFFINLSTVVCVDITLQLMLFYCHYVKGATEEPEVIPDPAKQTDRVVKIAGFSAGVLVFILLVLVAILLVKKRWVTAPQHVR